jgi:hypothetical protein
MSDITNFQMAQVKAFLTDMTCGEKCWNAKEDICRCECGGKNHGIHLRGGNAVRACKIDGRRYELVSVGKHRDLLDEVERLILADDVAKGKRKFESGIYYSRSAYDKENWFATEHVHPSQYQGHGSEYVLKYATLPQLLKWKELEYFQVSNEKERYFAAAAILWKRKDIE